MNLIQTLRMAAAGTVLLLLWSGAADALPSFARQTGMACSGCHVNSFGPNLTPYGRNFKLRGYTDGNNSGGIPAISGMLMGSFTHTEQPQQASPTKGPSAPKFDGNDNVTLDEASLFYGGRVAGPVGAFAQLTYSGIENRFALDNVDIRFARDTEILGQSLSYGVSLNNSPTVQDLWNTTPVWGFPYTSSALGPGPGAGTLLDDAIAQQVGGATLYAMINNLLYVEAGAYADFSQRLQNAMGVWSRDNLLLDGSAPYWRVALQHEWDGQYIAAGTFGLRADILPGRQKGVGTDHYTDLGADITYQYLGSMAHVFEVKGTYIREYRNLDATQHAGGAAKTDLMLNTLRLNGSYTYDQTYTANLGYFQITGTRDPLLYADNAAFRPDSQGFIAEFDYVPFGKNAMPTDPWLNLRLAVQYVGFTKFDGSTKFTGQNNTLFLNGWLAF